MSSQVQPKPGLYLPHWCSLKTICPLVSTSLTEVTQERVNSNGPEPSLWRSWHHPCRWWRSPRQSPSSIPDWQPTSWLHVYTCTHPGLNPDMQWSLLFLACFSSQTTKDIADRIIEYPELEGPHQDHWVRLLAMHRKAPRWSSTVQDLFLMGNLGINNLFSGLRSLSGTSLSCIWDWVRMLGRALAGVNTALLGVDASVSSHPRSHLPSCPHLLLWGTVGSLETSS